MKREIMNMNEDQICILIGLDKLKRAAMARYFGRLTEDERIEAVKLAYDLARQNMGKVDDSVKGKPDFFYAMICLSLWKMNWTRSELSKKNPNLTPEQAREISERRLASLLSERKDRMKRGRLKVLIDVRLFHVVRRLRNERVSWRECAEYLKKYHKTKISHVHIRKLYHKIIEERKLRGEE